ncbi:hypothetical protein [Sphingobacterium sp. BIGb0116]|uniref:hypothetical protein n=1 Tax=Sphingobacterium sp. BIGb0116 TaxID=2940619 RepID=UPI00216A0C27|nr:hypothetical protein [Sphingobacterium sp. BIGb0116]MCS4164776.1 hypothetical protein [Sphingobacterium sp. BIGb0116]
MYIDYTQWEEFEYKLNSLNLDVNNPRLKHRGSPLNQKQIIDFLIKNEKVYELAKKISEEGYFVGEAPIICIENNKKVVLEGNRRTAALKVLQDPKKYLSNIKANILLNNLVKNNFPAEKKLRCYIAPNRLLANPIIYSRHNGLSLEKWKTGNQYVFVAEMYYEDGLSIEDICEVLNESKAKVLKPLRAYNLFLEGQDILNREDGISIDIGSFEFTNLERFYNFEGGKKFLGIDFDDNNGELIIKFPREEFEKRLLVIFKRLLDSERFSRDFNKEDQKTDYIKDLYNDPTFDLNVKETDDNTEKSKSSEQNSNLEQRKGNTNTRRKSTLSKSSAIRNFIIPRDYYLTFENEKLDLLFNELKCLPVDRHYSFAILIRTYLEQVLYFYIEKCELKHVILEKTNIEKLKNNRAKTKTLVDLLKGKYKIQDQEIEVEIHRILKFDGDKNYLAGLKVMLDYIKNQELAKLISDPSKIKNITDFLENVKNGLDLAVHNIDYMVDLNVNRRAWSTLSPLFEALSNNISKNI